MSTKTNTSMNDFQTKVLSELAEIRQMLSAVPSTSAATGKAVKAPRKPRDPNAKPNDWIVFTGRVRTALKDAGLPAGKACQQFASYLKSNHPDAYSMTDEEIVGSHADWTPPPPKPKEADSGDAKPSAPVEKPKRTLSDEQKAKMAAGRKAAAERKKAEQAVESNAPAPVPAPAPAPVAKVETPAPTLRPLPFKGKKYLWDPESNGMWVAEKDGSKGKWAGVLSADRKSLDATAPNPDDAADE